MTHKEKNFNSILLRTGARAAVVLLVVCAGLSSSHFVRPARTQTRTTPEPCRPQGARRGCSAKGKPGEQT
jgi:hypothetical protein